MLAHPSLTWKEITRRRKLTRRMFKTRRMRKKQLACVHRLWHIYLNDQREMNAQHSRLMMKPRQKKTNRITLVEWQKVNCMLFFFLLCLPTPLYSFGFLVSSSFRKKKTKKKHFCPINRNTAKTINKIYVRAPREITHFLHLRAINFRQIADRNTDRWSFGWMNDCARFLFDHIVDFYCFFSFFP